MYNLASEEKVYDIRERTFKFGVRIVWLVAEIPRNAAGLAVGNQLVRSGTGIGANVVEAQNAGTKKEFIRGMTIALKEARETEYWLNIVAETDLISKQRLSKILEEIIEIIKILTTIIKKSKGNNR